MGAVLARLHRAALELAPLPPRPGQPSLRDLDLRANWMWELEAALEAAASPAQLAEAWAEVSVWRDRPLAFGPIHSDYYPGNAIALRGRSSA